MEVMTFLWVSLLAPIIVGVTITTYSYWLQNRNKNK